MAQAYLKAESRPIQVSSGTGFSVRLMTSLFVLFFASLSLYQLKPPAAVAASAPPIDFSSGRAMRHVEAIAQKPHPIGSPAHAEVRDYIIGELTAAGLTPQVQKTTVMSWKGPVLIAATVENIVARLSGTATGKAVMLAAHYDSTGTSFGASDDGCGVAAILETLRALRESPPLKNDIIFLFTDGEEVGLLGAKAFIDEHPLVKEVGVVLNFEARGSNGPSMMFETTSNNGWLVGQMARSAPYPVANSLSYEVYKRLSNDTDFTAFKDAGLAGLNFAYIDGFANYHTRLDKVENTDERSLQHHGSYALALTRQLGNADLASARQGSAVYFDLLGLALIRYPSALALPLAVLSAMFLAWVIRLGLRKRLLTGFGTGSGSFLFLLSVAAAFILGLICAAIYRLLIGKLLIPQVGTYKNNLFLVSIVAIAIGVMSALYIQFRRKLSVEDLWAGGLLLWTVLAILASLFVPGASYLFTWPLLFGILALGWLIVAAGRKVDQFTRALVLCCLAVPALVMIPPIIYLVFTALALNASGAVIIMVCLLAGLLIPQLELISGSSRWLLPTASALASLAFVIALSLTAGFDERRPKPSTIFYLEDVNAREAIWASHNMGPDEWTSQFISADAERYDLPEYLPFATTQFLKSKAQVVPLAPPEALLLDDASIDDVRRVRLLVRSSRTATDISIYIDSRAEVRKAVLNGKPIPADGSPQGRSTSSLGVHYYAPPAEGIELTLEVKQGRPLGIRVVDRSYGLPETDGAFKPWPDSLMPTKYVYSNSTLVSKLFTY